ncbi:MAG: hypothetical protein JSU59_04925, partial [Nitrospirota bacterium]
FEYDNYLFGFPTRRPRRMNELSDLWNIHQNAAWPESLGNLEGELMMLDTVIAGCVMYFLEEDQLDAQRVGILQDSLTDLEQLLPELSDSAFEYFERLRKVGSTLLENASE